MTNLSTSVIAKMRLKHKKSSRHYQLPSTWSKQPKFERTCNCQNIKDKKSKLTDLIDLRLLSYLLFMKTVRSNEIVAVLTEAEINNQNKI